MRYLALCSVLWLGAAACDDEDAHREHPHDHSKDAGPDAATGGKDAGTAQATGFGLPSPGLPRPTNALPAELRPPR